MGNCRYCGDDIVFAWRPDELRWLPIDPESVSGDETVYKETSVIYESYHRRHRCTHGPFSSRSKRGAAGAAQERKPPPRTPPRAARSPPPRAQAHATLFVTPDAPPEVIRAAYKALAMLYHPDLGGDSERMVELNRAYETLVGKTGPE